MAVTPKKAASATTKKPSIGTRAWRRLRLAVLWARRGGAAHSLRLLRTLRRHGIGHGARGRGDRLRYGEREFSIDETPAFRFRTPSARVLRLIPCIAPATPGLCYGDDRYFFADALRGEDEGDDGNDDSGSCYYGYGGAYHTEIACDDDDEDGGESCCVDQERLLERDITEPRRASTVTEAAEGGEDAGVDVKAEEFIARFYAQMKLQRQISWLQFNEMMQRSVSK